VKEKIFDVLEWTFLFACDVSRIFFWALTSSLWYYAIIKSRWFFEQGKYAYFFMGIFVIASLLIASVVFVFWQINVYKGAKRGALEPHHYHIIDFLLGKDCFKCRY
jgi:hypothetical protein